MRENGIPLSYLPSGKKRVLIIDDEPAVIDHLMEILERDGRFEIRIAPNGFDGGMATMEFIPDLVLANCSITDLKPDLLIQQMRRRAATEKTKVIFMSMIAPDSGITALLEGGTIEYRRKPFNVESMVVMICQLLKL